MAFIALRDPGTDAVVFRQWPGTRYDEYRSLRIAPGQGAGGQVLATGRPFRTDCYLEDARIGSEFTAVAREEATRAHMAVPPKIDERVEGVLAGPHPDAPPPPAHRDRGAAAGLVGGPAQRPGVRPHGVRARRGRGRGLPGGAVRAAPGR